MYKFPHFHNSLTTTLLRKWSLQYGADLVLRASFSPALQPWVALSSPIFQIIVQPPSCEPAILYVPAHPDQIIAQETA